MAVGLPLLRHAISGGDDALLAQWENPVACRGTISAEQLVETNSFRLATTAFSPPDATLKAPDRAGDPPE